MFEEKLPKEFKNSDSMVRIQFQRDSVHISVERSLLLLDRNLEFGDDERNSRYKSPDYSMDCYRFKCESLSECEDSAADESNFYENCRQRNAKVLLGRISLNQERVP